MTSSEDMGERRRREVGIRLSRVFWESDVPLSRLVAFPV